ncbi:hypothetical protein JKP88DRAFT_153939, partial [Tribonema minus]
FGEELKCPVCLSYFNNPTNLPCNHPLCEQCALQILANTTHNCCPTCRQEFNKRQLGRNVWIQNVMTAFQACMGEFGLALTQSESPPP